MKLTALGLASLLLLTGCSSSPKAESVESLVKRACETRNKDTSSALAQSLFVDAANQDENYRELARANSALMNFLVISKAQEGTNPTLKALAIQALSDIAIIDSYCD